MAQSYEAAHPLKPYPATFRANSISHSKLGIPGEVCTYIPLSVGAIPLTINN